MKRALLLFTAVAATPAFGTALTFVRATSVVSDQVSTANPKALPGSTVEYTVTVTNPNSALAPVASEVITEAIPAGVALRVADLNPSGSGPVEFADGSLLGSGLLASGLSYGFAGLSSTTDDLQFYDGSSWSYTPVADGSGFDSAVRAIRVTLHGTHVAGTSFRLRYRVKIR